MSTDATASAAPPGAAASSAPASAAPASGTPTSGTTASDAAVSSSDARCSADELRKLFLFEKLSDDQLGWLCREGRVIVAEPGRVYAEGDPATALYVLLSGTVVLSRQIGADDIETSRTSSPGVYSGAFYAYLGNRVAQVYNNSMRVTERSRFFVLDAARFAQLTSRGDN